MSDVPHQLAPRAATVRRIAQSLGFALVGIAPAEPTHYEAELKAWLAAGKHGEMDYLAAKADQMVDPRRLVPGAKSVICVADQYGGEEHEGTEIRRHEGTDLGYGDVPAQSVVDLDSGLQTQDSRPRTQDSGLAPTGRIARYAHGDDYHRVMKDRLHQLADDLRGAWPQHTFRSCVDTAPLLEREHAARAGLGWIGKHTLLIHPQLGSWLLLGEIVTTLPLESSADAGYPEPLAPPADHCGTCTRCIDACPTHCITPHSVDASRCISYLTIEHRGPIDPALHPMMGDWLAGCDVCQEVCPFNAGPRVEGLGPRGEKGDRGQGTGDRGQGTGDSKQETGNGRLDSSFSGRAAGPPAAGPVRPEYRPRPPAPALPLLTALNWSEDDRRAALTRSALKRIKLDMWKRNALIAAGNHLRTHADETLRRRIESLSQDDNEAALVRETAAQVVRSLTRGDEDAR